MQIDPTDGKINIKGYYLSNYRHMMNICVEYSMKTMYKFWGSNQ